MVQLDTAKCTGVLALPVTLCGAARHCLVHRCPGPYSHLTVCVLPVVSVIGFARNMVSVNEADGSAILTVRVLMGVLAPGATAVVEFTTANRPPSDTSAIGKPTAL